MPSLWHGLEAQVPIRFVLQVRPVYDGEHKHLKVFDSCLTHVPPLKHGLLAHGSLLVRDDNSQ